MRSLRLVAAVLLAGLALNLAIDLHASSSALAQDPSATTTTTHNRTLDTTAPLDVEQAPRDTDFDLDKLQGPRLEDSTPGRAAGAPLGIAAVAIFVVVGVAVFRSARSKSKSKT